MSESMKSWDDKSVYKLSEPVPWINCHKQQLLAKTEFAAEYPTPALFPTKMEVMLIHETIE